MENKDSNSKEVADCCKPAMDRKRKESRGFLSGITYGLVPHAGCMVFLLLTIFGITGANYAFGKFLFKTSVFYSLIVLSFLFATASAFIYVRRKKSTFGKEWKYLGIMYTTVIAVNLLMIFIVFPAVANASFGASAIPLTGQAISSGSSLETIKLDVSIPCSGHAPLIISELKKAGATDVQFIGSYFVVSYDPNKISRQRILSLDIFKEFKAQEV